MSHRISPMPGVLDALFLVAPRRVRGGANPGDDWHPERLPRERGWGRKRRRRSIEAGASD